MRDKKLIEKWLCNTPTEASVTEVERILVRYFGDDAIKKQASGSHQYRVRDPRLEGVSGFGLGGHLSIPVNHGKTVKGRYLRSIAMAIQFLEDND